MPRDAKCIVFLYRLSVLTFDPYGQADRATQKQSGIGLLAYMKFGLAVSNRYAATTSNTVMTANSRAPTSRFFM